MTMKLQDIALPEIYKESADFRFFLDWFSKSLSQIQYDTENLIDCYDPLRCKEDLLWMLGDTIGFKYDDRLCTAYNRLVMLYFMSMIRNKGSRDGVTLAAEVNLAQFNIIEYGKENDILQNRLEDTSIPVNAVYVTQNVEKGYIDIVYFTSNELPIDACIEYVRPLGMYCFQHSGVRYDSRTKLSIDARLTNTNDMSNIPNMITRVGHYSRNDYARMQHMYNEPDHEVNTEDTRRGVWYRNKTSEVTTNKDIDPGYRALYSLQLSNNEHIVKSLFGPDTDVEKIFGLGKEPITLDYTFSDDYVASNDGPEYEQYNLRYDKDKEEAVSPDVYTIDADRSKDILNPRPAVNPVMSEVGSGIVLDDGHSYIVKDEHGNIVKKDLKSE